MDIYGKLIDLKYLFTTIFHNSLHLKDIHQELPEYSYSVFDITKHITDYNLMSVIPIMESSFIYGISRYRAELS